MKPPHRPGDNPGGSGPLLSGPKTELHRCNRYPQGNPQVVPTVTTAAARRAARATQKQTEYWVRAGFINAERVGTGNHRRWTRLQVAHLAATRILGDTIADVGVAAQIGAVAARCASDPDGDQYVIAGRDHIVTTDDPTAALRLVAQMHGVITVVDVRAALGPVLATFDGRVL